MDYNYIGIEVIRRLFSVRDEQILRAVFDIEQFIAVCAVVYVKALGVIQDHLALDGDSGDVRCVADIVCRCETIRG